MALYKSSNPALSNDTFTKAITPDYAGDVMTLQGTINKIFLLLVLVITPAMFTWDMVMGAEPSAAYTWMMVGGIGGFVVALITIFSPKSSPYTAPLYAVLEGLLLGGISAFMETIYPGIAIQAVLLTMGTLLCMLFLYKSKIIKVTENFKMGVIAATGGIAVIYLVSIVMGFFGVSIPFIHESGWMGIGFSLFVVAIAALNLVLDFDFIEKGAEENAPKYMEWYAAFGLILTLVWLYIEFLRLLSKLRSR